MVRSATANSSLEASGDDEVTLSQPSDIVVSAPEDVSLHDLPDDGLPAPKPSKNKQKPTSWDFHDVGLSVDSMVALSLPHSKQWEACWRYVMGVVDLACRRGAALHRWRSLGRMESQARQQKPPQ